MLCQRFLPLDPGGSPRRLALVLIIVAFIVFCGSRHLSHAQPFGSGSTGADGALVLTTPGTVIFDPRSFTPPLDPEGDNIYHFTSITIGAGVIVRLAATHVNGPVFWLASGPVQIDGIIDLNGESGHDIATTLDGRRLSVPGAGGIQGVLAATETHLLKLDMALEEV